MSIASNQLLATTTVLNFTTNTLRQLTAAEARRALSDMAQLRESMRYCEMEIARREKQASLIQSVSPADACAN